MNLEWLLSPFDKQEFLDFYLEQQPLVISRNNPHYFEKLLTLYDLNELMSHAENLGRLDVVLVNAGKKYQLSDYAKVETVGNVHIKSSLNISKALQLLIQDKATIVINQAINEWLPLRTLAANYAQELNTIPGANIFIAPPNAECFGAHFDEHDLFILQIYGSKHWRIYENPIFLPLEPQNERNFDFSGLKLLYEIDLQQGDILYLPRGFVHDVTTTDRASVHISFGGQHLTWASIVKSFVTKLAKNNRLLRQGMIKDVYDGQTYDQMVLELLKKELELNFNTPFIESIAPKFSFRSSEVSYF